MRFLPPSLFILMFGAVLSVMAAPDPGSALAALEALPVRYQQSVVKVTADNGTPNPPKWYILANKDGDNGALTSIVVARGQVLEEKPSLNLGTIFRNPSAIDVAKILVDSPAAFAIAKRYALANASTLGSVSYALQQKGRNAAPVWALWCYDQGGSYTAYLEILATDGTVVTNDGYPKVP